MQVNAENIKIRFWAREVIEFKKECDVNTLGITKESIIREINLLNDMVSVNSGVSQFE